MFRQNLNDAIYLFVLIFTVGFVAEKLAQVLQIIILVANIKTIDWRKMGLQKGNLGAILTVVFSSKPTQTLWSLKQGCRAG